ncbi:MAG TPA: hypothetical protein VN256_03365 [Pyrinomonadaceae bacterium]|nr:hypothetical protein [Pyrinomonadaceae bacterium]
MAEELCKGVYLAQQVGGTVLIVAFGKHGTAGYTVRFRDTPIAVFPPEFQLVHTAPSGPAADVETEFVAYTMFPATDPVKAVVVHDADGEHTVAVEQTPDEFPTCAPKT